MYLLTYLKNQGVYKYDLTTPACTLRLSLHRYPMDGQNDIIHILMVRLSDCCLTPNEQYFRYIMARKML